jgi:hypothetical protein
MGVVTVVLEAVRTVLWIVPHRKRDPLTLRSEALAGLSIQI